MRLLGFRYLRRRRLAALALVVAAASFLFSFTSMSLAGLYRGLAAYLGEGGGVVAVYDPRGGTPYTGLVPASLAERLAGVNGVLAVSPEVIAPCLLNGEAVFLRGIVPSGFVRLSPVEVVEGEFLDGGDVSSAVVGENLARRLGLRVNGHVLLLGVLADRYAELRVKGVFRTGSMLDDEVLAPLHVGQWLRGSGYGWVTIIRLRVEGGGALDEVRRAIAAEALGGAEPGRAQQPPGERPPPPPVPWAAARLRPGDVGVEEASRYMARYLEKYGVTREAVLVLSVAVFLFSSLAVILASEAAVAQHRGEVEVLRALGASRRLLKADLAVKLSPWILASSAAGMLAASAALAAIQELGRLQVLSHEVPLQLDPLTALLNFALAFALALVGILRSDVG